VKVLSSAPVDASLLPVAVPDAATTLEDVPTAIPVLVNDAPSLGTVILTAPPANGTATVNALTGAIDYTPRLNYSGPDSLSYMVQDVNGYFSNSAAVSIEVLPVNDLPIAAADSLALPRDSSATVAVLANDRDLDGVLVPGSVTIALAPTKGVATVNADGSITYRANPGASGADTFGYTVADDAGGVSNVGVVSVTIFGSTETLSIKSAQYTVSQRKWVVVGQTTFFGPTITTNFVTFYDGTSASAPVLGTAAIDTAGKFQWAPNPGSVPAPNSTNRIFVRSNSGGSVLASVALK
jgi:large repetitive protein